MKKAIAGMLLLVAASLPSFAQERKIFTPPVVLGEGTTADLRVIENWSGSSIANATVDLCFAQGVDRSYGTLTLGDYDRAVVQLKNDGRSWKGASVSTEARRPVSVDLRREPVADGKVRFSGAVVIDGVAHEVSADVFERTGELSEDEPYLKPIEKPERFGDEAAPNALAVTVKNGSQRQLFEALRKANVKIDLLSGGNDKCTVLRSGTQTFRVLTPPERSAALVETLRKLPFVLNAGWTQAVSGAPNVRVTGNGWIVNGAINREKVSGEFAGAIAKHIDGRVTGTDWDEKTGEIRFTFSRPSKLFPGFGLTEKLEMVALVAPERPGATNSAIIWAMSIYGDVVDEGAGPRLGIVPLTLYAGPPEAIVINLEPEILAQLLGGESWDSVSRR